VRKIETVRRYRNLLKVFVISAAIVGAWIGDRATNLNLKIELWNWHRVLWRFMFTGERLEVYLVRVG